jgi:hypothetical protein
MVVTVVQSGLGEWIINGPKSIAAVKAKGLDWVAPSPLIAEEGALLDQNLVIQRDRLPDDLRGATKEQVERYLTNLLDAA